MDRKLKALITALIVLWENNKENTILSDLDYSFSFQRLTICLFLLLPKCSSCDGVVHQSKEILFNSIV